MWLQAQLIIKTLFANFQSFTDCLVKKEALIRRKKKLPTQEENIAHVYLTYTPKSKDGIGISRMLWPTSVFVSTIYSTDIRYVFRHRLPLPCILITWLITGAFGRPKFIMILLNMVLESQRLEHTCIPSLY